MQYFSYVSFSENPPPVELVVVDTEPNSKMRLNVVNISNFFLLSGEVIAASRNNRDCDVKDESNTRGGMSTSSFKFDQNLGIIQGRVCNMAVRVVEFSNWGCKIEKLFA